MLHVRNLCGFFMLPVLTDDDEGYKDTVTNN